MMSVVLGYIGTVQGLKLWLKELLQDEGDKRLLQLHNEGRAIRGTGDPIKELQLVRPADKVRCSL